ncbi:HAD family hydrolase [Yinghuangia seranimata]|uniref:HAD family hydrolase n=1 Tax=Yinghuangia seranimata TaxID=408067 RepID=UPI00248C5485|nr:HAD family hydrolase [Yinghuangia seranimata]MDI2131058.1 HAD family hydrolase [Yinghuangia seranimata]
MPIRGVLFDVDDTLFDYTGSDRVGVIAHLRAEGLIDAFPEPAAAFDLWHRIMVEEYTRFLNGELTFAQQQRERARRFLAHAGPSEVSDDEAAAWFGRYTVLRNANWAAFPDAEPVLRKLAPDYRLGIVSNSSADHQRHKLDVIGLLPYVADALVCSEQHGAAKPAASIFAAGCRALGLPPHEVAYVGDKYDLDAVGAREAGLRAYWLDRGRTASATTVEPGIRVLQTLDELPAALID